MKINVSLKRKVRQLLVCRGCNKSIAGTAIAPGGGRERKLAKVLLEHYKFYPECERMLYETEIPKVD